MIATAVVTMLPSSILSGLFPPRFAPPSEPFPPSFRIFLQWPRSMGAGLRRFLFEGGMLILCSARCVADTGGSDPDSLAVPMKIFYTVKKELIEIFRQKESSP